MITVRADTAAVCQYESMSNESIDLWTDGGRAAAVPEREQYSGAKGG